MALFFPVRQKNFKFYAALACAGISEKALASRCGLCCATISRIANCRLSPKPATIQKIAAALKTTPAALGLEVGCE